MGRVDDALVNEEDRNNSYLFLSMDDVTEFRVTGVQLAEECGMAWKAAFLSKDGVTPPASTTNKYTITGTLIHLVLEDELMALSGKPKFLTSEDHERIKEHLTELGELYSLTNAYEYLFRLFSYTFGNDIVDIEKDFIVVNDKGMKLSGHADLVMRDKVTGLYTILDHKTNRRESRNDEWQSKFQIQAYANAACEEYGVDEVRFIIGNVNLKEDNIFMVQKSRRLINLRIGRALSNIETERRKIGKHCYSCGCKDECGDYAKSKEK